MKNIPKREDLEDFLDHCAIGVHLVSVDGTILWANQSELNFLEYSEDEYVGENITEFHRDADVINTILTLLTSGSELNAYPARLLAKNGNVEHVLINSNVYRVDGEFIHTRCFTSGITKTVYEELRLNM
ncbi:MAG: PAS domain-containing protein [Flavobacteriales bacterium]|nr:PAS domain-containing protein [Flavobacteriales bacterium]